MKMRARRRLTTGHRGLRVPGKKGERIVHIRTLIKTKEGNEPGRSISTIANTDQYL